MVFKLAEYLNAEGAPNNVATHIIVPSIIDTTVNRTAMPNANFSDWVKPTDIASIPQSERNNFLLQRKVNYEPVIQAPDGLVKTEIRILFIWENGAPRPIPFTNLARLSRGEMILNEFAVRM